MEEAIQLFKSGMFVKDIAKKLGLNTQKLSLELRALGFSPKSNASTKSNHPNWKNGRILNAYGYIRVRNKEHPRSCHGYILEHILVAEKKIGRYLNYFGRGNRENETVHHLNGIKTDNRPENLEVITASAHSQLEWDENPHKYPQSKTNRTENKQAYEDWRIKNKDSKRQKTIPII
jgi:hypothetical protein